MLFSFLFLRAFDKSFISARQEKANSESILISTVNLDHNAVSRRGASERPCDLSRLEICLGERPQHKACVYVCSKSLSLHLD